jgi:hypothetical protein
MFFYNMDYMLMVFLPSLILMGATSWYVKHNFNKWSKVYNSQNISGTEAVESLKQSYTQIHVDSQHGTEIISALRVASVGGWLSDHYDPGSRTIRLSPEVAQGRTVAAMAIAIHELGHAIQDEEDYWPMRLRTAMVPYVKFGSTAGWIMIFAGLLLNFTGLAWLGLIAFASTAAFSLATLPVEFDASNRAKRLLRESGFISYEDERRGVNAMLNAAALTYVAALVTSLLQVLYFASMINRRNR